MHSSFKMQLQIFRWVEVWTLLLCLGSLFCWMTQFGPSFSSRKDGLTFPPRVECSTQWLQRGLCILAKYLHFGLIYSKDTVPEVLWFVQMQFCESKPCCHVFILETRNFLLADLPKKPSLFSLSSCTHEIQHLKCWLRQVESKMFFFQVSLSTAWDNLLGYSSAEKIAALCYTLLIN